MSNRDPWEPTRRFMAALDDLRAEERLPEILAEVYTPEGVALWLTHAEKQGWSYEERLQRALNAADGNFS